jgi:hypothetical protein
MPGLDPREDVVNCIAPLARPPAEAFADGTYYRFFTDPDRADAVVVVAVAKPRVNGSELSLGTSGGHQAALKQHALKALFRFPQGDLTVIGGSWVAVRLERGQMIGRIGDCPDVRWSEKTSPIPGKPG